MDERFTPQSADALRQAEVEARRLHSPTIEAEHLLLALSSMEAGVAADVLHQDCHLAPQEVQIVVDEISAKFVRSTGRDDGTPTLSAALSSLLNRAAQEAQAADHAWIGTEHLLLGLMPANDRLLREIFQRLELRPQAVRAHIHARVPEIPLADKRWAKLRDRARTEFYHNFAYYVPQPIRKLFGRFLDASQMPPLG